MSELRGERSHAVGQADLYPCSRDPPVSLLPCPTPRSSTWCRAARAPSRRAPHQSISAAPDLIVMPIAQLRSAGHALRITPGVEPTFLQAPPDFDQRVEQVHSGLMHRHQTRSIPFCSCRASVEYSARMVGRSPTPKPPFIFLSSTSGSRYPPFVAEMTKAKRGRKEK